MKYPTLSPKYILWIFLVLLGLQACSSDNQQEKSSENDFQIEKIDSFEVNNLTRVIISDYSEQEKTYLGYATVEDEILEIDLDGNIIQRAKKKGDGPGNYGNWNPIGMSFGPDGLRIAELPFALFAFDSTYQTQFQQRIQSPLPIRAFGPLGKTQYFESNDSTFFLVGPSNYLSAHYLIRNEEGRDTLKNFYKLHLESGEMKSVVPYRAQSVYRQTEGFYPELMTKSFQINRKTSELLVLHGLEDEIEVYDLPGLNYKGSIPLKHEEFLTYNSVPIEIAQNDERITQLRMMAGRNISLIQIDEDLYLISYFTGITPSEYDNRKAEDPLYSPISDLNEKRLILIKNKKQLNQELPSVPGIILFGMGSGKFLVQEPENSEIEEEVTRFSIYQVRKK